MVKQGGSVKTWKKRWFVLKGSILYYFKQNKPDQEEQGQIELTEKSYVKQEEKRGKKHAFSVFSKKRVFYMYAENDQDSLAWMKSINSSIERIKSGSVDSISNPSQFSSSEILLNNLNTSLKADTTESKLKFKITKGKGQINYLKDDNKLSEFWLMWINSIPNPSDLNQGIIEYCMSTSSDMLRQSWRSNSPQNIAINKMIDFFWNVGTPENEIERLNDIGSLINPVVIGSWIDISVHGGMDGGWFFPVNMPIKFALEACDQRETLKMILKWSEKYNVEMCKSISRDMGAAPPRQSELKFDIPGNSFEDQLRCALDCLDMCGFPPFLESLDNIIKLYPNKGLSISLVTSNEGFVKFGLWIPDPPLSYVEKLCQMNGDDFEKIRNVGKSLDVESPTYVEYQYLQKRYGYGVYKEGTDINFHYALRS